MLLNFLFVNFRFMYGLVECSESETWICSFWNMDLFILRHGCSFWNMDLFILKTWIDVLKLKHGLVDSETSRHLLSKWPSCWNTTFQISGQWLNSQNRRKLKWTFWRKFSKFYSNPNSRRRINFGAHVWTYLRVKMVQNSKFVIT